MSFLVIPLFSSAQTTSSKFVIYRLYNPVLRDHLYTQSADEEYKAETLGYHLETTYGFLSDRQLLDNQSAFYRLYNNKTRQHFYTDNNDELTDVVVNKGFVLEGKLGFLSRFSNSSAQQQIYRLYNPVTQDHFYTIDYIERDAAVKSGYLDDGSMLGRLYSN